MHDESQDTLIIGIVGVLLVGVLLLSMAPPWLDLVERLQSGPGFALERPKVDYLTGTLWALALTVVVAVWGKMVRLQRPLLLAWAAKVVIAQVAMPFYDFTYGLDPDGYFGNAASSGFSPSGLELGQGTTNMHQLVWVHVRWLSSSFSATRLSFALLGLISVFLVYRAGVAILGRENKRLFYVLALTPSILFWSSILGKDPVSLFSVSCYLYGAATWYRSRRASSLPWVALGVCVALFLRVWLGPILLLPFAVLATFEVRSGFARLLCVAAAVATLVLGPAVIQTASAHDVSSSAGVLQTASDVSQSFDAGGSSRDVREIRTFSDLTVFAPLGIFTVLFRPLPGEVRNVFGTLAGVENLLLLFVAIRAVARTRVGDLRDPIVLWLGSILLMWGLVYSVAASQNLGTASRYRLEITPLLIGFLLYMGRGREREVTTSAVAVVRARAAMRPSWTA